MAIRRQFLADLLAGRHSFANLVQKMMSVIGQESNRFDSHWNKNMAGRETAISLLGRLPLCTVLIA